MEAEMLDLIYIATGVFFLALMGLYARACGRF
jgi:hypothetical protein